MVHLLIAAVLAITLGFGATANGGSAHRGHTVTTLGCNPCGGYSGGGPVGGGGCC